MHNRLTVAVIVALIAVGMSTAAVSAQDADREIQFEDEVTVGEETVITYVSTVQDSPIETTAEVELTLSIDGEEIETSTEEEEIAEGAEIVREFTHTFDSAGEKDVRIDSFTEVLGQTVEETTEATVSVAAGEDDEVDDEADDEEMDDGDTDDEMVDDEEVDDEEMDDGDTDDETMDDEEEGLPGFTAVVALISLAAVAAYRRQR